MLNVLSMMRAAVVVVAMTELGGGVAHAATTSDLVREAVGHWRGTTTDGATLDLTLATTERAGVVASGRFVVTLATGESLAMDLEAFDVGGELVVDLAGSPRLATKTPAGAVLLKGVAAGDRDGQQSLAVESLTIGKRRQDATRLLSWKTSAKTCRSAEGTMSPCGDGVALSVAATLSE